VPGLNDRVREESANKGGGNAQGLGVRKPPILSMEPYRNGNAQRRGKREALIRENWGQIRSLPSAGEVRERHDSGKKQARGE